MGDDLVAEEIEVDPVGGAAPLRAAEQPAVEGARGVEIVDREGEVEGRQAGHAGILAADRGGEAGGVPLATDRGHRAAPRLVARRLNVIASRAKGEARMRIIMAALLAATDRSLRRRGSGAAAGPRRLCACRPSARHRLPRRTAAASTM